MKYEDIMEQINKRMREMAFPVKPKTFNQGYEFPEDLTQLSSEQIGNLMGRLAAYRGYAIRQLGIAEIRKSSRDDIYGQELKDRIAQLSDGKTGITLLRDKAMSELREDKEKSIMLDKICKLYQMLIRIYDGQLEVLSREISRRKGEVP